MYGECDAHPSGYGQGNAGFSGMPLWKVKQQTQHHQDMVQAAQQKYLDEQEALKAEKNKQDAELRKGHQLYADAAVKLGRSSRLVRHVIVRDLRKVSGALNIQMPSHGVFAAPGPRALLALFDGHGAGGQDQDPKVVETCCRALPTTVLRNLAPLANAPQCTPAFVKASLLKTFEDLPAPAAGTSPCGAAVLLVVGDWVFTAALGRCSVALCKPAPMPRVGGKGASSSVTYAATPLSGPAALMGARQQGFAGLGVPEVQSVELTSDAARGAGGGGGDCFVVMVGTPVAAALNVQELASVGNNFTRRPRAVAGEITTSAANKITARGVDEAERDDCAAVVAFFVPPQDDPSGGGESAAKKAKTAPQVDAVRLRQIVVKHKDCKFLVDPLTNKPATRSQAEAEALLRETLLELLKDGNHSGNSKWAAQATPRIVKAVKDTSECKSALKGGSQCGDLGWISRPDLDSMGKDTFAEPVRRLAVGEWSDVLHSEQGAHLVMRIA